MSTTAESDVIVFSFSVIAFVIVFDGESFLARVKFCCACATKT
jgi:hypothetical protein